MHRTNRMPRPLAWSCFIALVLAFGVLDLAAQEQLPPPGAIAGGANGGIEPQARTEIIGVNQTRRIGMSTRTPIVDLQNENPTVVRIDKVDKDPTTVFVTGIGRGKSRLIFTDINKRVEQVIVRTDDTEERRLDLLDLIRRIAPTAAVQATIGPNNTVILTGYVNNVETGQRIMEAARAVFSVRDGQINIPATVFNGMTVGGVQQVQLEVVAAVVSRSRLRTMSFSFAYNDAHVALNSVLSSPTNFATSLVTTLIPNGLLGNSASATGSLVGSPNLTFGFIGNSAAFHGYLEALTTEGLAKILADTRVTTLSGRPAAFNSGGSVPLLTSSGFGAPQISYQDFGTVVSFLPIVQNGKIHLEVRSELSAVNAANSLSVTGPTPTSVPGFSKRSVQSAVQLEDGQTLAIGGLIQNTVNATIQRVPLLGDIPFLNVLFTNKSYQEVEEEMLVIVTPRLVDGFSCDRIPKYLPGRETRNPDDFELFLEGIMEAPRGPRYISANPLEYKGAHMLSPNAGAIPCAATPHLFNGFGGGLGGNGGCATCGNGGPMSYSGAGEQRAGEQRACSESHSFGASDPGAGSAADWPATSWAAADRDADAGGPDERFRRAASVLCAAAAAGAGAERDSADPRPEPAPGGADGELRCDAGRGPLTSGQGSGVGNQAPDSGSLNREP